MQNQVRIRSATETEHAVCISIAAGLPAYFSPTGLDELRHDVETADVRVAEVAGKLIGFVILRRKSSSISEILWLAVAAGEQGSGVGSALINDVADDVKSSGPSILEVKTLDASAPSPEYEATRHFYESHGFELLETIDPYPGWDVGNPCAIYVKSVGGVEPLD